MLPRLALASCTQAILLGSLLSSATKDLERLGLACLEITWGVEEYYFKVCYFSFYIAFNSEKL